MNLTRFPNGIEADVVGNLAGNVDGNVLGSMIGNLEGNIEGNVEGKIEGDLQGNILGNLEGNLEGVVTGGIRFRVQELVGDGSIEVKSSIVALNKGSSIAATIAMPSAEDNGTILYVISITAQAHTIAAANSSFVESGGSQSLATFGAGRGTGFLMAACGGNWYVLSKINVMFS